MRHLVNLIPLPRALAELVLIVGLFLCAIVVSRIAGLLAAWLVSRRAAVAPGREWLAEDLLPTLARERTDGLLVHGPGRDADRRASGEPLRPRGLARPGTARASAAASPATRSRTTTPAARVGSRDVTEIGEQPLEQQLEEIRGQLDWARGYL